MSSDNNSKPQIDPAIITAMINRDEAALAALKQNIAGKSSLELLDFVLEDLQQLRKSLLEPQTMTAIMAFMNAASWLNEKLEEWLGEKNAADTLSQSVADNVTSEMGLALLDVADVIRPYPEVIARLQETNDDHFLDTLPALEGGKESRDAILQFLDRYGMRCAGEIDITRPRWSEKPLTLLPLILTNVKNMEPGASKRRFEQGLQEAMNKEREVIGRLKQLPDGEQKATETKRMIDQLRTFAGFREHPKYAIVSRFFVYKQALLKESEKLVRSGIFRDTGDMDYLTVQEFREVLRTQQADQSLIRQRKEEHRRNEKLRPPRVITSDGEIAMGRYKRENIPQGAIVGLAVSSGIIEGRARVVLDMRKANLEEGDILITTFTDPSWTPLFVSIKGLVTEVGGLMTHGAVIAREYGLPAVVGAENATKLIRDGQRIRVNGTDGYIELL